MVSHQDSSEEGTRRFVRLEFARLRKYISIDTRIGFGEKYVDYGGMFRVYKHWRFADADSSGLSLGLGGWW